jgi:hypothetical protein
MQWTTRNQIDAYIADLNRAAAAGRRYTESAPELDGNTTPADWQQAIVDTIRDAVRKGELTADEADAIELDLPY